jgi:hypothetical protein
VRAVVIHEDLVFDVLAGVGEVEAIEFDLTALSAE